MSARVQLELFSRTREPEPVSSQACHRCAREWEVRAGGDNLLKCRLVGQTYAVCPKCGAVVVR